MATSVRSMTTAKRGSTATPAPAAASARALTSSTPAWPTSPTPALLTRVLSTPARRTPCRFRSASVDRDEDDADDLDLADAFGRLDLGLVAHCLADQGARHR